MNLVTDFYRYHEGLRQLIRELAADPGARTLDVGCKKGELSRALARSQKHLVALDLERHREWQQPGDAISFVNGNALFLPFADTSFDVVVASECLQYINRPEMAVEEFRRVLKDGGRLLVSFPQGGRISTLLDPYNLNYTIKNMLKGKQTPPEQLAGYLRAKGILSFCQKSWVLEKHLQRGSYIFILSAWLIDRLQGLRLKLGPSSWTGKVLAVAIKTLFHIMKLDFSVSYSSVSYNTIILLRKVSPALEKIDKTSFTTGQKTT